LSGLVARKKSNLSLRMLQRIGNITWKSPVPGIRVLPLTYHSSSGAMLGPGQNSSSESGKRRKLSDAIRPMPRRWKNQLRQ